MFEVINPWKASRFFSEKMEEEKNWLYPLVIFGILIVLGSISGYIFQQKIAEAVLASETMPPIYKQGFKQPKLWLTALSVLGAVFVGWIVKGIIFHVFAIFLGGEERKIKDFLYLLSFTYIPAIFQSILGLIYSITYTPPPFETLSELLYGKTTFDLIIAFVRQTNIFAIWSIVLIIVLVKTSYKFTYKKASLMVLIPYIVWWAVTIGLMIFGKKFMEGFIP